MSESRKHEKNKKRVLSDFPCDILKCDELEKFCLQETVRDFKNKSEFSLNTIFDNLTSVEKKQRKLHDKFFGDRKSQSSAELEINAPLYSSEEQGSERTIGSWDIPNGSVAWDDKDGTLQILLDYDNLILTEEEESGVLTDRIIAACSSYLTRSPASKCYVVGKVCLDNKNLSDIKILGYHRFLQYVDLSWNNVKDLSPMDYMPYLMYLDVSHNLLENVLSFKPPWNLTYANYSHNDVWEIDDLTDFWSLSYLDLSHNKISKIQGLDGLRYLRYLNLSHNKIRRFENLNYSRITDLNLEYNLISSFEKGDGAGLKTMVNLKFLSLNNNLITDLEFLKEVHNLYRLELQENKIENLMELSHMKSLKKLRLLDLTGNPVGEYKTYRRRLISILPDLQFLDQTQIHPTEKVPSHLRHSYLGMRARGIYNHTRVIELDQLNQDYLDLDVQPYDQIHHPLMILVGPTCSGKKSLVCKLGQRFPHQVCIGKHHITREILDWEKSVYIRVDKEVFFDKMKKGQFLFIGQKIGYFYGFSKEMYAEAVRSKRLCLTFADIEGAMTVRISGISAYFILTLVSSEKEHMARLKKRYGPIRTMIGATYISKRELGATHESNIRRVQEIIHDLIQEVVFLVDEPHNMCFVQFSGTRRTHSTANEKRRASGTDVSLKHPFSSGYDSQKSTIYTSNKDLRSGGTFECMETCSPTTCGLQEMLKKPEETNQDVTTEHTILSVQDSYFEDELRDEGSGTNSTSYSAIIPPPVRLDQNSLDDEENFGEDDDIFADWSSPFIDWDEVNIDADTLQEEAEELCDKFISRIMATRKVYESINLEDPGFFSIAIMTDNEDNALESLTKTMKYAYEIRSFRGRIRSFERDYAYSQMIPMRLQRLKEMIDREMSVSGIKPTFEESIPQANSPRTIITQMQMMGYKDEIERV